MEASDPGSPGRVPRRALLRSPFRSIGAEPQILMHPHEFLKSDKNKCVALRISRYSGFASEGAQLLFDCAPLPGQEASTMHAGSQTFWQAAASRANLRNGVSATNRFNLSENPHRWAMTSNGPANSLLNSRHGASGAQVLRTSPFSLIYIP